MFTDPKNNCVHAGLYEGMHVGDFGVGSGAYTLEAIPLVRDDGAVYAIDVQKGLLERLESALKERNVENVQFLHGDLEVPYGSRLRDGALDFGIASNVLFQVRRKQNFIGEVRRCLRPKGKMLLVDWKDSFRFLGPSPEQVLSVSDARLLCEIAGFRYVKSIPSGRYHYGMVFEKV